MQLAQRNMEGAAAGTIDVADEVFAARFNEDLVHQAVTSYMAGARAGTKAQKSRSDVRGGGRKPWRQKGTGRARAGTNNSPIWRGGGRAFAASPRSFDKKLNRKMYRAAVRGMVSELARLERLHVVDTLQIAEPKTRLLAGKLGGLGLGSVLIVIEGEDRNLELAARNLPLVDVCVVDRINPLALVAHEAVLISAPALRKLEEVLK